MSPMVCDERLATSAIYENIYKAISPTRGEHQRQRRNKQKSLFFATVADKKFKMADQDEREARLVAIAKSAIDSDIDFMELIREFPTIYNKKSKDFHDKRKKENCWKAIAGLLNTTTQEAERRYKTIRTSFTRYLSKQKGKSGSGLSDIGGIDPRFEHLRWLITHIKTRESASNINVSAIEEASTGRSLSDMGSEFELSVDATDELSLVSDNEKVSQVENKSLLNAQDNDDPENSQTYDQHIKSKYRKRKDMESGLNWIGAKKSQKIQLKDTEDQIKEAMKRFDKSLELLGQQNKQHAAHEMDEESLFCLSLAPRLRRLSPQKKAMVRNSIENIFFQIEYGNS